MFRCPAEHRSALLAQYFHGTLKKNPVGNEDKVRKRNSAVKGLNTETTFSTNFFF